MPSIELEIISTGLAETKSLDLSCHINKYVESFLYTDRINSANVPISYLESKEIDSWEDVKITDRTHILRENNIELLSEANGWTRIKTSSFSAPYRDILLTDKTTYNQYGKMIPLFYKHELRSDTIQAEVTIINNDNEMDSEEGLVISLNDGCIYTNCENTYDPDTGNYKLYFVLGTTSSGESYQDLLNPIPAIGEAQYTDIDLDPESPTYGEPIGLSWSRLDGHSGIFTYVINNGGSVINQQECFKDDFGSSEVGFYFKPLKTSGIKLQLPSGRSPSDPWSIKITNGYFWNKNNKYWLPEYNLQPFTPEKPYIYSPYRKMLYVNKNTLVNTRGGINIDPENFMHASVYTEDEDGKVISVYTTDPALIGKRYSDTDLFYEGEILCWDNSGGFIALGLEINPSHSFYADYYYKADEYEYSSLVLNPIQNKKSMEHTYVFYMVPNLIEGQKAVHVLHVDANGVITQCSQNGKHSNNNLSLTRELEDGSVVYNEDTVVGTHYISADPDCFQNKFCVPYKNDHKYYILGEVAIVNASEKEDVLEVDVSETGESIVSNLFESAIRKNPKILLSSYGVGAEGQRFPENNVSWIRAPIRLLENYGGELSETKAKMLLETFSPASNYNIIEWDYNNAEINGYSTEVGLVELEISWEGPGLTYNIYRRETLVKEWGDPIATIVDPDTEAGITYTDNVESGIVYYYGVKIVENEIEFPFGNTLGVMAR